MPYSIRKKGSQWCVYGPSGRHGCHDTRAKAIRQQRALYRAESMSDVKTADGSPTLVAVSLREEKEMSATKDLLWNLRLAQGTKSLWDKAAEARGMTLSEYVREVVTESAVSDDDLIEEDEMSTIDETATTTASPEDLAVVLEIDETEDEEEMAGVELPWEGVLGTIGAPTTDGRYPVPDAVSNRDLPVELHMQPVLAEGHDGAVPVGSIDSIAYVPFTEFDRKEEFYTEEQIAEVPEHALVVFGNGMLNGPHADEARRRIDNGADVSLDGLHFDGHVYDAETFELVEVDFTDEASVGELYERLNEGSVVQGLAGEIGGATIVSMGAFKEARIITASAGLAMIEVEESPAERFAILVAAAGPVKPPREWFEDPMLMELTPLQIGKDGRVFGHLADWNGCHTGFQGVCVPPFHSLSSYAFFNVGEIETAEGELVPCGKLMFSMEGAQHASTSPLLSYLDVQRYYDDATKVGAFVRAGSDRFGTWLAGALRPGLNDIEIQHLRTHPPSGDWRPIRGGDSDLIAAFSVPIPGYPIPRPEALVASAGGQITAIISAPITLDEEQQTRVLRRRTLLQRHLGHEKKTRADLRRELAARIDDPDGDEAA